MEKVKRAILSSRMDKKHLPVSVHQDRTPVEAVDLDIHFPVTSTQIKNNAPLKVISKKQCYFNPVHLYF